MRKPFSKLRGSFRHKRKMAAWSRGYRDGVIGHTSLTHTERIRELASYSAGFKLGEMDFFTRHSADCICDNLLRSRLDGELDNVVPLRPRDSA